VYNLIYTFDFTAWFSKNPAYRLVNFRPPGVVNNFTSFVYKSLITFSLVNRFTSYTHIVA